MIYTNDANFPYPLLTNGSDDYDNSYFKFDVDLSENNNEYIFKIKYDISSDFIKKCLINDANLVLIVKSKDNRYYIVDRTTKEVRIPKSRLSFDTRSVLQLMIQTTSDIGFANNNDLVGFYNDFKDSIVIKKGMILGFSNIVKYNGSDKNPFSLFIKTVDDSMESDIEVEVLDDIINIKYKNENLQLLEYNESRNLNNPYIYIGLQKALIKLLLEYGDKDDDYLINVGNLLDDDTTSRLNEKLLNLMDGKGIEYCDLSNIDYTIQLMSDNIIKKYVDSIRRIYSDN